MIEKLACKMRGRPGIFCEDHQPARVLIYPVNQSVPGKFLRCQVTILTKQVMCDTIDQRSAVITAGRVYDHADRFIDDQYVVVFIFDVKVHGFRKDLLRMDLFFGKYNDYLSGFNPVICLYFSVVHQHISRLYRLLHLVSRSAFNPRREEFIKADGLLTLVYNKTKPLIQLLRPF